ncbi:amino acid ABC transporter permease [Cellulomonas sp. McL0617]|uniref:amino acid ABC transporter permease n=1 Tax=Cellulomonas sp. McL0617 TaxID=3415675 RepID=UPI003CF7B859
MSAPTTVDTQGRVPERIHAVPVRYPGRWVSAVVVLVLAAMVASALITNDNFAWPTVAKYLFSPQILRGVRWTIWLTVASMAIAIVLAVLLAIMRRSGNPVMRYVAWVYIWFFRGTPIYTQLIFWGLVVVLYPTLSLGVPFGPEFLHFSTKDVFLASRLAVIGLALNEAAYLAEIVRAGLQSVDTGQSEAARALGMSDGGILRRIVLPQAMRVIVPPTGNETISMLKTTSLVIAVPFTLELNSAQANIANRIFEPVPLLVVAALWYLAITSVLMVGQSYLERYYGKGFDSHVPTKKRRRVPRQAAINAAGTTHDLGPLEANP